MTTRIRRPSGRFPLTLIRSQNMETFVAHPAVLPLAEVAVPFTIDDSFYDDIGDSLPDCSVAFLHRAGAWSARTSHSGFVPAQKLPRFSDDPRTAMRALQSAGIAEWVSGGIQIHEGNGITIVNAADVSAEKSRQEAATEAERAGKSAGGQHGNHRRWHERRGIRAPGCEFCKAARAETTAPEKRTSHSDRIRFGSDSDATPIDRSDLDLSSPVSPKQNHGRPTARASDPRPGSHAFRIGVTAKFAAVAKVDIAPETADAIAADVLGGKKHVDHKLLYVLTAIDNEADPIGRWLPGYGHPAPPRRGVPDWCGKCDPNDHGTYDEFDRFEACPACHPKFRVAWRAA